MSTQTENYGFIKADETENYSVEVVNNNLDSIDAAISNAGSGLDEKLGNTDDANATQTSGTVMGKLNAIMSHENDMGNIKTFLNSRKASSSITYLTSEPKLIATVTGSGEVFKLSANITTEQCNHSISDSERVRMFLRLTLDGEEIFYFGVKPYSGYGTSMYKPTYVGLYFGGFTHDIGDGYNIRNQYSSDFEEGRNYKSGTIFVASSLNDYLDEVLTFSSHLKFKQSLKFEGWIENALVAEGDTKSCIKIIYGLDE